MRPLYLCWLVLASRGRTEDCRQVEVEEVEVCEEQEVSECGQCSTVHLRECTIRMVEYLVPVTVRRCRERSPQCGRGGRQLCRVEYRTTCSSHLQYQEVEEDVPECRREKVQSCPDMEEEESERENMVTGAGCRMVDVTRCRIQKKTVKKARPVTKCQRLPTNMCAKRNCKKDTNSCHRTITMTREERPEERCTIRPRRICKGGGCRKVLRKLCRPSEPGNKEIHTVCQDRLP